MKPFLLSTPASQELAEAVQWYEQRRPDWGGKLFDAVTRAIEQIRENPEIGSPRRGRRPSREWRVNGFPYKVAYRIRENDIYVVAIAHTSRRPLYWKSRK